LNRRLDRWVLANEVSTKPRKNSDVAEDTADDYFDNDEHRGMDQKMI
jgi:hypothetical protein